MLARVAVAVTLAALLAIAHADAPASEVFALTQIYKSTNGSTWFDDSNWLKGDPCANTWEGVLCDGNDHVYSLTLHNNNLLGTLPDVFANLTYMQFLYLSNNKIAGPIPPSIGGLVQLQQLGLDNNSFSGEIPSTFTGLAGTIQHLFLQNNNLEGSLDSLSGYVHLVYFYASNNRFTGTIPSAMGDFEYLQQIGLDSNKLTGDIPAGFGVSQDYFQSFYVQMNSLTGTFPAQLCSVPNCSGAYNNFSCPLPPSPCCQLTTCNSSE